MRDCFTHVMGIARWQTVDGGGYCWIDIKGERTYRGSLDSHYWRVPFRMLADSLDMSSIRQVCHSGVVLRLEIC